MAENKLTKQEADKRASELEEKAAQELPERGYLSKEVQLKRQDELQKEAERIASQMQSGTIDPKKLEIANEIANKTQYLSVSNADPAFVYGWVSRNRHSQHIQAMKQFGWVVVQGDDEEAIELKGTQSGQGGAPGTTRELGDVVLMKIPKDRYVVLKALEVSKTRQLQKASTSALLELGNKHRDKGIIIRPYRMDDPEGDLSGPEIKPQRFSNRQNAMRMIDKQLRDGTVEGMVIQNS
jgi:hypothetical protein